jgi:hypothetical protein
MDVVRKIVEVKNNSIMLKELSPYNNRRVEVIVLPLPELEERPSKIKPLNLRKYAGCIKKFGDGLEYQRKIRLEWENE